MACQDRPNYATISVDSNNVVWPITIAFYLLHEIDYEGQDCTETEPKSRLLSQKKDP